MGLEAQPGEIQIVNEDIDHSNGVVLGHVIIQSFGEQGRLVAIIALNKSAHHSHLR
jgi:hypothetical protein